MGVAILSINRNSAFSIICCPHPSPLPQGEGVYRRFYLLPFTQENRFSQILNRLLAFVSPDWMEKAAEAGNFCGFFYGSGKCRRSGSYPTFFHTRLFNVGHEWPTCAGGRFDIGDMRENPSPVPCGRGEVSGCFSSGVGNIGATPSPTLPRCASLRGREQFGGRFGGGLGISNGVVGRAHTRLF